MIILSVKKKIRLIDGLIDEFINDLYSFRIQLIYMSYLFNSVVLWAVICRGLDWKALSISFGTQTAIYLFYFTSKRAQSEIEHQQSKIENNIVTEE